MRVLAILAAAVVLMSVFFLGVRAAQVNQPIAILVQDSIDEREEVVAVGAVPPVFFFALEGGIRPARGALICRQMNEMRVFGEIRYPVVKLVCDDGRTTLVVRGIAFQ